MYRCFILLLFPSIGFSQHFTHGPIVGAVTDSSARIYIRTSKAAEIELVYSQDLSNPTLKPSRQVFKTLAERDTSYVVSLNSLKANTKYEYSLINTASGELRNGKFSTFVTSGEKGNYAFAFGSCSEHIKNDSIFIQIQKVNPFVFMHLGDWTYPDHKGYPNNLTDEPNYFYSTEYEKVQECYRTRYSLPILRKMLLNIPIDFIHDDDDFAFDGNSRSTYSNSTIVNGRTVLIEEFLPSNARSNAIKGYIENFPHYDIAGDTSNGVYHQWRYGNIEVFFVDSRANRSPDNEAFVIKNDRIKFRPKAQHSILGETQMEWLLENLKNSTADWKFIVSGTNFNMGYKQVMDMAIAMQNKILRPNISGGTIASSMASMWVGFPHDQYKLINYIADNHIKNVVVLSGDSHNSAIDDGKNGGLPELMSGNLGVPNSHICDIVYNKLGVDIWNYGGQGIGNKNFNFCFGKVDVFQADSVKLSVIDVKGNTVCSATLKEGFIPTRIKHLNPMIRHTLGSRLKMYRNFIRMAIRLLSK